MFRTSEYINSIRRNSDFVLLDLPFAPMGTMPAIGRITRMRMKPAITLDDAKKLLAAAEDEARRNGWEVVIAILNDGGRMVALHRMDGARPGNDQIAIAKATTSAMTCRPTVVWEKLDRGPAQGLCDVSVHRSAGRAADHHRRRPDRRDRRIGREVVRGRADRDVRDQDGVSERRDCARGRGERRADVLSWARLQSVVRGACCCALSPCGRGQLEADAKA